MEQFPTLVPSEAPIIPGAWPATHHQALNGAESSIRHGSAAIGGMWRPRFVNITYADFLAILDHYRGQRSGFDSFGFSTITLAADRTPAGSAWLYASRPQVVDHHVDVFTVECEFRCEPRGLVAARGVVWRTGATTFTPGARSGGVVYAAGANWVTSETTFTPGARADGVGSNAGVQWATSSTTFTPGARDNGRDPYRSSVSLHLSMDGANNSTTFTDSSSNNIAVTAYGDAKVSTADPKIGSGILTLDGNGDYLETAASSALALGTEDLTVEFFALVNSGNTNAGLFTFGPSGASSGLALAIFSGNWYLTQAGQGGQNMGAVTTGSLQHVAVTRSGSSLRLWIEGAQLGSTISSTTNFTDNRLIIGWYYTSSFAINAKVDEFRVTEDIARYTEPFTPPTGPFPTS